MELFKLVSLAFVLSVSASFLRSENKVYIKATRCVGNEKFIYKNVSCYAKSYSRTYSASFMYMLAKAPITKDLKITATLYYKYGLIFRDVIRFPTLDICSLLHDMLNDQLHVGLAQHTLLDMVNEAAPGLIHECPYHGLFVKNASWSLDSVPSIFPSGEYKVFFNGTIANEFAGTVSVIALVDSPNKDNFG